MQQRTKSIIIGIAFAGIALITASGSAQAEPPSLTEARVVVAVNESATEPSFSADACKLVQFIVYEWNLGTQPTPRCVSAFSSNSPEIQNARASDNASLLISIQAQPDETHTLTIENWATNDPADFRQLRWKIEASADWKAQTRKLLSRFAEFDANKKQYMRFLLVNGLSDTSRVGVNQAGYFDRKTGSQLSFDVAYAIFRDENPKQKNYIQAAIEIGGFIGAATVHYYVKPEGNIRDWEYDLSSSIRNRLNFRGVRYDDNYYETNEGHYFAGTAYYMAARSNGLDRMESLLYTLAASSTWEYVAEFREAVSINDQINTTLGGFIFGEVLHEMGRLFSSGSDSLQNRMLRAAFGSPDRFNSWMAKTASGKRSDISGTGFKPDVWGKAGVFVSMDTNHNAFALNGSKARAIGFDAQVIDIPLFETPGQVRSILTDTVFAKLFFEQGMTSETMETFKLFAKTTLAAYYEKNLGLDRHGDLNGYNLFVGPSMALDIEDVNSGLQNSHSSKADFRGIVHVVGGTLDLTAYTQGYRIRCTLDVYGDFAMMRAYAFDRYMKNHDVSRVQNVLREHDYYYGAGTTASAGLVLNKGRFEVGAAISETRSNILNGRTRFASDTDKVSAHDRRAKAEAWVAYQISDSVKVRFGIEKNRRSGSIGDTNLTGDDIRKTALLIYTFK